MTRPRHSRQISRAVTTLSSNGASQSENNYVYYVFYVKRLMSQVFEFKPLRSGVDSNYVLGGDLNPILGFCFPLCSMVFPYGISIRVETCGSGRKQKCGLLWSIYVQIFYVF
jgi:hypothetical protein